MKVPMWPWHYLSSFSDVFLFTSVFLSRVYVVKEAR